MSRVDRNSPSHRFVPLAALCFLLVSCGEPRITDPDLRQIQEMLEAQVPAGSSSTMVNQFVAARGYPIEPSGRADAMVVIIRHIDQQKLKPVTARVTFHFDATDKLRKMDIERIFNQAIPAATPPAETPPESQPQSQAQPKSSP